MVQKIYPHPAPGCNRSPPYYVFSKDAILGSVPSISSEVLVQMYFDTNPVKFIWWLKHILSLETCFTTSAPLSNKYPKRVFFWCVFPAFALSFWITTYIKYKCTLQFTISFLKNGLAQKSHYSSIVVRTSQIILEVSSTCKQWSQHPFEIKNYFLKTSTFTIKINLKFFASF